MDVLNVMYTISHQCAANEGYALHMQQNEVVTRKADGRVSQKQRKIVGRVMNMRESQESLMCPPDMSTHCHLPSVPRG